MRCKLTKIVATMMATAAALVATAGTANAGPVNATARGPVDKTPNVVNDFNTHDGCQVSAHLYWQGGGTYTPWVGYHCHTYIDHVFFRVQWGTDGHQAHYGTFSGGNAYTVTRSGAHYNVTPDCRKIFVYVEASRSIPGTGTSTWTDWEWLKAC